MVLGEKNQSDKRKKHPVIILTECLGETSPYQPYVHLKAKHYSEGKKQKPSDFLAI